MPFAPCPRRIVSVRPISRLRSARLACALGLALAAAGVAQAAEKHTLPTLASEAAGKVWTSAQDVTVYALSLLGVKYRFGGTTPDSGLDCSGLVRYVFQEVTGMTLPRTAKEQSGVGAKVGLADLLPGDLVFFNTRRFANSHVGIYLGDNRFIHAPSRGGDVEVATMSASYWQRRFNGARRLVESIPALMPSVPSLIPSAQAAPLLLGPTPPPALEFPLFDTTDVTP